MAAQRDRARAASKFGTGEETTVKTEAATRFSGYEGVEEQSKVLAVFRDGQAVDSLADGEEGISSSSS